MTIKFIPAATPATTRAQWVAAAIVLARSRVPGIRVEETCSSYRDAGTTVCFEAVGLGCFEMQWRQHAPGDLARAIVAKTTELDSP